MGEQHCTKRVAAMARTSGKTEIVALSRENDDFGVYGKSRWLWNKFETPLLFRGTLDECLEWRKPRER